MSKADVLRIPDYIGHIVEAIERIHIWKTIHGDLPELHDQLSRLLASME